MEKICVKALHSYPLMRERAQALRQHVAVSALSLISAKLCLNRGLPPHKSVSEFTARLCASVALCRLDVLQNTREHPFVSAGRLKLQPQ